MAPTGHSRGRSSVVLTAAAAAAILLAAAAGCGNRNSVEEVQIANAPDLRGADRLVECDACHEHSGCGRTADATIWATDHYKRTGHAAYTRRACVGFAEKNLSMGTRSRDNERPSLEEQRATADKVLSVGMHLQDAQVAFGEDGTVERESKDYKTVRFRQRVWDWNRSLTRDAWADVDPNESRVIAVRYGPWHE